MAWSKTPVTDTFIRRLIKLQYDEIMLTAFKIDVIHADCFRESRLEDIRQSFSPSLFQALPGDFIDIGNSENF